MADPVNNNTSSTLSAVILNDRLTDVYSSLNPAGKADKTELERVARWERSSEVHSNAPNLPGSRFPTHMCGKLMGGADVPDPGFWLLYCSEQKYGVRAHAADVIDELFAGRPK